MKQIIQHISRQEPHIQTLIGKMVDAVRKGRNELTIERPKLTADQVNWLRKNEFEPECDDQLQEWIIPLN